MEALKDIFVSYEIAQKLKEIGFDELCIGAYDCYCMLHTINSNDKFSLSKNEIFAYAPTWEQVKKWFRGKEIDGDIRISYPAVNTYHFKIVDFREGMEHRSEIFNTYEQAQEQLILKLIEIYKNGEK